MNPQARAELLLSYARGPRLLREALEACPREALDFVPGPGAWSPRSIFLHMAESELHAYIRARTIIAEPGNPVLAYDQDKWAASLDGAAQPLEEAVDLFRLLREMLARQLRALPDRVWEGTMLHSQQGPVTLERWLETYEHHLVAHLRQLERTLRAWRES